MVNDIKLLFKGSVLVANVLPVFSGFWLAVWWNGFSFLAHLDVFLLTVVGSTLVMAGALALNNWYDVDIDRIMERTKKRPTVTGRFSLRAVLITGLVLSVIGLAMLLFVSLEATLYALVGWVTYVLLYTMWSKRRYTLNTVIGSISGAVPPLIGWSAIDSSFQVIPIILFLILFFWQMPHTFAIAIRKHDEYKAAKVAMLPVVHGMAFTKWQVLIYSLCLVPLPFYLWPLGWVFVGLATIMNIGFLAIAIKGFFAKSDLKWARLLFLYSVNYIMIIFLLMIIVTLPIY
ncbi:protoheme IX farnesyltransferase [Bacillus sp. FJAT-18017]|uniref:heme o synthase n=1 Tax=Bacillus sp. FJAT-18017 TaxID=1705566 RepID=UPI0006ADC643|nr:heme o synthase [Bacillus sp. FJAT-18017]ALC89379.1 protoheme IX farnesyltransferase [Bacillus sp. FJAT-18017]